MFVCLCLCERVSERRRGAGGGGKGACVCFASGGCCLGHAVLVFRVWGLRVEGLGCSLGHVIVFRNLVYDLLNFCHLDPLVVVVEGE